MSKLREYQQEDVDQLRNTLQQGAKRVLFEASVGYGRSVVIEHLAAACSAVGRQVWVLSNRSEVVNQLRKRAGDMPRVTVMTVQAADRRRDNLAADRAHLILVDEVHMGGAAAQYRRALDTAPGAVAIGFTGTPRPETFEVFPDLVQGKGAAWLTDQGFLAPLKYTVPNELDLRHVKKSRGEFDEAQIVEIMSERRIYSVAIENFRVYGPHVPTLGFCVNVGHATDTADQFRRAGHACEVLSGKDNRILVALSARFHPRGIFWRQNAGRVRSDRGAWVSLGPPGISDIVGLIDGRAVVIEVKTATGKQREAQGKWQAAVEKAGGIYIIGRSPEEAVARLEALL